MTILNFKRPEDEEFGTCYLQTKSVSMTKRNAQAWYQNARCTD